MNNTKLNYLVTAFLISLPLERILTFDLFGFTIKISYVLGLILLIYVLLNIKKTAILPLKKEEIVLLLFNLWSLLSIFWALNKERSLVISLMLLFMSLIFIALRRIIQPQRTDKLLEILLNIGLIVSFFAFWQYFADTINLSPKFSLLRPEYTKGVFPFPRVQSTFLEPLFFANFLAIPFFAAVYLVIKHNTFKYYIYFSIITLSLLMTLSRGGIFSIALTFAIFLVILLLRDKTKLRKAIMLFLSGLVSIFLLFAALFLTTGKLGVSNYINQLSKTTDVSSTEEINDSEFLRTRDFTNSLAMEKIKERPILGIGTASFGNLPEFKPIRDRGSFQTVNNEYLELLVENGLIGLILFLSFVCLIIIWLVKKLKQSFLINLMFLAIISTWLIQYMTFSGLGIIYMWVLLGLACMENPYNN